MNNGERYMMEHFKTTREVTFDECFMGGKHCATCAHCVDHDSNFREYENDYCVTALRSDDND